MSSIVLNSYSLLNEKDIIVALDNIFKTLDQFEWIIEAPILDFFVENHWQKLIQSWQKSLENVEPIVVANFIFPYEGLKVDRVWPLSLLALQQICYSFSISRIVTPTLNDEDILPQKQIRNILYKKVKLKKRHEIDIIAKLCGKFSERTGVKWIVDIGSGLGHLARILSYCYNLKVIAIERNGSLTMKAQELDKKFRSKLHLSSNENKYTDPIHLTYNIEDDFNSSRFLNILKTVLEIENETEFTCGIVGLHPCGNLGPILLRLYSDCNNIKFICNVGCCYMKLTTHTNNVNDKYVGFPMSKYCKDFDYKLNYYTRELACHAIESYYNCLKNPMKNDFLRIHCFRAALENLIDKKWPHAKHIPINNVKYVRGLDFYEYCNSALHNRSDIQITKEDCLDDLNVEKNLKDWNKVLSFHALRTMISPLIESAILLDRTLFLVEKGHSSFQIDCLFNPEISPRAHVLSGYKTVI